MDTTVKNQLSRKQSRALEDVLIAITKDAEPMWPRELLAKAQEQIDFPITVHNVTRTVDDLELPRRKQSDEQSAPADRVRFIVDKLDDLIGILLVMNARHLTEAELQAVGDLRRVIKARARGTLTE